MLVACFDDCGTVHRVTQVKTADCCYIVYIVNCQRFEIHCLRITGITRLGQRRNGHVFVLVHTLSVDFKNAASQTAVFSVCNFFSAWEDDSSSSHADECDPTQGRASQCLNGGVCRPVLSTAKFVCSCPPGFTGSRCETVAASESRRGGDPCSPNPCLHGGVCSTDRDGKTAVCRCMEHWTGKHCQVGDMSVFFV